MNLPTLAIIASLPCLAIFALNTGAIYGHYAYSLPVEGSTVQVYELAYVPVEEDDYKYGINFRPHNVSIVVSEHPAGKYLPAYATIKSIAPANGEAITVYFAQNNYTITRYDGRSYKPAPVFSHTMEIGINQTFVVVCNNPPADWPSDGIDGTGLVILQYRGVEVHNVTDVMHIRPVVNGTVPKGETLTIHGDSQYTKSWKAVTPPREIPAYKFLRMSAYTHSEMQCDYPQVIEYSLDSKRVDPADIKSVSGALYDLYRQPGQ